MVGTEPEALPALIQLSEDTVMSGSAAAIVALGACGTMNDIPLLESLRTKFPVKTERQQQSRNLLIDQVERDIRKRSSAK